MKKVLKIIGILLLVLVIGVVAVGFFAHQPEPQGTPTAEADALADDMMAALNKPAWDSTRWLKWNFADRNQYIWDKERHLVQVTMGDDVVLLNPDTKTGTAFTNGKLLSEAETVDKIESAWSNFCNDSFWFNAPMKAKDPGTTRSLVTLKDGRKGLKVQYTSGGVTPGDSYVWILDDNNKPVAYKMWVGIIPVGGVEATWEDWQPISTGALISRSHKLAVMDLKITDVAGGMNYSDVGLTEDIFNEM